MLPSFVADGAAVAAGGNAAAAWGITSHGEMRSVSRRIAWKIIRGKNTNSACICPVLAYPPCWNTFTRSRFKLLTPPTPLFIVVDALTSSQQNPTSHVEQHRHKQEVQEFCIRRSEGTTSQVLKHSLIYVKWPRSAVTPVSSLVKGEFRVSTCYHN